MRQREFSEGDWRQVGEGVYVAVCQPASVNVGLVVGAEHVLMVDCGSSPGQGMRLAASAAAVTGRLVDRVVVTHGHFDHFFGLAGVQTEGVVGIGHESLSDLLDDAAVANCCAELGFDAAELVEPNTPIAIVKAVDLGGRRVEVVGVGPAHSPADLVVFVPDAKVVFTGDILEIGADPSFGPDSRVGGWPIALDTAIGSGTNDTVYVPGHGAPVDRTVVAEQRANVSMVFGQTEQLVKSGVKLTDALAALDTPEVDGRPHRGASEWPWPFATATIKQAMPLVYAELAAMGVQARTQLPLLGGH